MRLRMASDHNQRKPFLLRLSTDGGTRIPELDRDRGGHVGGQKGVDFLEEGFAFGDGLADDGVVDCALVDDDA